MVWVCVCMHACAHAVERYSLLHDTAWAVLCHRPLSRRNGSQHVSVLGVIRGWPTICDAKLDDPVSGEHTPSTSGWGMVNRLTGKHTNDIKRR